MKNNAAIKAILAFLGVMVMYFGAWYIYCMISSQVFMVLAFQPLVLLGIVLAGVLYAMHIFNKHRASKKNTVTIVE